MKTILVINTFKMQNPMKLTLSDSTGEENNVEVACIYGSNYYALMFRVILEYRSVSSNGKPSKLFV